MRQDVRQLQRIAEMNAGSSEILGRWDERYRLEGVHLRETVRRPWPCRDPVADWQKFRFHARRTIVGRLRSDHPLVLCVRTVEAQSTLKHESEYKFDLPDQLRAPDR